MNVLKAVIGFVGCFVFSLNGEVPADKLSLVVLSPRKVMIHYNLYDYKELLFTSIKLRLSPGDKNPCGTYLGYAGHGKISASKFCFPNVSISYRMDKKFYTPKNQDGVFTELTLFYVNKSTLNLDSLIVEPRLIIAPDKF